MEIRGLNKETLDIAYQMKLVGFTWDYKIGDLFTKDLSEIRIVLDLQGEGDKAMVLDKNNQQYAPKDVVWLPRWTDCVDWLKQRGYAKVCVDTKPNYSSVEITSEHKGFINGIGKTDLEAIYSAIVQVLELEGQGD
jgi:hypothetical protein